MLVRSRMTAEVVTVTPETSLKEALALTRERAIRHLPVVAEDRLVGVVTDRDLRLAVPPQGTIPDAERDRFLIGKQVGDLMVTQDIMTTSPDTLVEDAARQFYEHKIGCLPVMEDGRLVGILTATDLLRAFVDLFAAREPAIRLEIRMPNRPGELARVVRIVGIDHKLNITGLVVPASDEQYSTAILHVQAPDPEPLIEHLRKLGYKVGYPFLQEA